MWSTAANRAFQHLKEAFTTTFILKHPDQEQPFFMEVDASETGVTTILSQHFRDKPKMHHSQHICCTGHRLLKELRNSSPENTGGHTSHNINAYVASCVTCAQAKVPHQFLTGKLMPLGRLKCPWSHITLDFLTNFSESEGYTTILITMDRFSQSTKLIPLRALLSTLEVAELYCADDNADVNNY